MFRLKSGSVASMCCKTVHLSQCSKLSSEICDWPQMATEEPQVVKLNKQVVHNIGDNPKHYLSPRFPVYHFAWGL